MGKIVTFWSDSPGTGKTTLIYMIVTYLQEMLANDCRILVCSLDRQHGSLPDLFHIGRNEPGLENLANLRIHPKGGMFKAGGLLVRRGSFFFTGRRRAGVIFSKRNTALYEGMLDDIAKEFDLCLVDAVSGREDALTEIVLGRSDHVIRLESLDAGHSDDAAPAGSLDGRAYTASRRQEDISGLPGVFSVPYCSLLKDMGGRMKLDRYSQYDTDYNKAVRKLGGVIAGTMQLQLRIPKNEGISESGSRKPILRGLLGGMG